METLMMASENPREKWTDERLDDLNTKVDDGFTEMREEFRAVRGELAAMNRHFMSLFALMAVGFISTIATVLAAA